MVDLQASDFPAFFRAVHGYAPFRWQEALAERVLSGAGWPDAVDVPTGLGKTAVIDIAVFALASQAGFASSERSAPTRTVFVVDRRVIVDQAFDRANQLKSALRSPAGGVLATASEALRSLTDGNGLPLEVVRMRGGVTWGWRWVPSPDQPAVVVGTVDQAGSRLLFRGYGVSSKLRPIDAALCGTDCLLILDEAHLSQALVETAKTVSLYESRAERPVLAGRRPRPVVMSATLAGDASDVHRLDPAAETSPAAQARLRAQKLVVPVELTTAARDPVPDLARGMAAVAVDALSRVGAERLAVVCNTVALARAVHTLLVVTTSDVDVCLLTGRCRGFEREQIAATWAPKLVASSERPALDRPLIAVATQTIEVGADFDVDLMVMEASPIDALVQRLGRLNRLGLRESANAVVIYNERRHTADPVYGPATSLTWAWLRSLVDDVPRVGPRDLAAASRHAPRTDLSPLVVRSKLEGRDARPLGAPVPVAPVALGPMLAAWARTDPAPEPDQPVAPFLHGIGRDVPQVEVCWRAGLPESHAPDSLQVVEAELDSVPVTAHETVEVPIWEARRFLSGAPTAHLADLEGIGDDDELGLDESRLLAAWVKRGDEVERARAADLKPGDTVVVRVEEGGHDEWGWTGEPGRPVVDVADVCQRVPTLRLRPGVLANVLGGDPTQWDDLAAVSPHSADAPADEVRRLLQAVAASGAAEGTGIASLVQGIARDLLGPRIVIGRRSPNAVTATDVGGWYVVTGARRGALPDRDGDEGETTSSIAPRRVTLEEHLVDVGHQAAAVGRRLGLPPDLVSALDLAGRAHDLGKVDWRFQVMLHGGDPLRAEASGAVLAKSGMDPANRQAFREALAAAKWPAGMRHEVLSLRLLRHLVVEAPTLVEGLDADLVLHLVGSHHGRGRPLFPAMADPDPQPLMARLPGWDATASSAPEPSLIDWEAPARFERLGRRYGWWGLALLEATLRLADISCSERYGREAS